MTSHKITTIDEYIDQQKEEIQGFLKELRTIISETIPEATERLAWGMPSFWDHKFIVHFDAFKDHVNVYIGKDLVEKYKEIYKDYNFTTRGFQLYYDQDLPREMIQEIVRESYRIEMEKKEEATRKN